MKTRTVKTTALVAVALISAALAQSKYSGIYSGSEATGTKFIAAISKGGRVLGLDESTKGIRNAVNPSLSTVDSSGHVKGATQNGASLSATITADFTIKGTFKSDDGTVRLNGKRVYN